MKFFSTTSKLPYGILLLVLLAGAFFFIGYVKKQNDLIKQQFDGKRWSVPATVYARPLELYSGLQLSPETFERELKLAGYREETPLQGAGGYSRSKTGFNLVTRTFTYPSGVEESTRLTVHFRSSRVTRLTETDTGDEIPFIRLDPARIGSFHPLVHEDRLVLKEDEIPEILQLALMAVEDKDFHSHHGVAPTAILRALIANIKAGRTIQGGSTLTQQLVKNFFLNRDRTLARKVQEAVMALLLEYHYSKEEILTAYINEVFLGQDGARAVHGFGLASQFYFRRDLTDLPVAQIATLVGMVKGPSYYDPRRHPERCLTRRNIVLDIMLDDGLISDEQHNDALSQPVSDVAPLENGFNRFPAFLELVRHQLKAEYKEDDLKSNGLKILTTLDPQVQWRVEQQLMGSVQRLVKRTGQKQLQAAAVITGRDTGEILAVMGSVHPKETGFNRALNAERQVGSLIKPPIYLAALARGYTLASPLMDAKVELEYDGKVWRPENYDHIEHGRVALYRALARSHNLATVNLGLEIGVKSVITTLKDLGHDKPLSPLPSLLLGAVNMSPLEVSQVYQTIASGGFYLPQRAIGSVLAQDGSLLTRYGLEVEQRFAPELMFLLTHGLERVMSEGTGASAGPALFYKVAGKTGTSNDLRDSWFAGFSDTHLGVVWLGNDDNSPIGLTGSSGALQAWAAIFSGLGSGSFEPTEPPNITWARIDPETLEATSPLNGNSTLLPFLTGTEPEDLWGVPSRQMQRIEDGARKFLDNLEDIFQ